MKKLIVLAITFLTLQGCENGCSETYLAIVNNSGKDIEISSYHKFDTNDIPIFSKKISILNNNKYDKTLKDCGNEPVKFHFYSLVEGDSIVIDYGDKITLYSIRTPESRNPYRLDGQNKANDFIYTLTPEDYANATPKP